MFWRLRLIGAGIGRFDDINWDYWQRGQFAGARDVVGTLAASEQAIVADAMESSIAPTAAKLAMLMSIRCDGHHKKTFFSDKVLDQTDGTDSTFL
jgi:hypothetical protein